MESERVIKDRHAVWLERWYEERRRANPAAPPDAKYLIHTMEEQALTLLVREYESLAEELGIELDERMPEV